MLQQKLKWHYGPEIFLQESINPNIECDWMLFQTKYFPLLVPQAEIDWVPATSDHGEVRGGGLFYAPLFEKEPMVARWFAFKDLDAWVCEIFTPWGQKAVFVHYVYNGEAVH